MKKCLEGEPRAGCVYRTVVPCPHAKVCFLFGFLVSHFGPRPRSSSLVISVLSGWAVPAPGSFLRSETHTKKALGEGGETVPQVGQRAFSLLMADVGLIPGTPSALPRPLGVTPEYRARSKPRA